MSTGNKIPLGVGWQTVHSDDTWYLVTAPVSGGIALECRFQSDRPEATGWPSWVRTEFCIAKEVSVSAAGVEQVDSATGHMPYAGPADLLDAARPSFVPERIWHRALEECRKLVPGSEG